tara:strand:+ start:478 stop:2595 length:2118 start_codon:yes stop_codon:yes gene_type:complete
MSVKDHLKKLKEFTLPNPLEGVQKLYFLEVDEKPNLVKIGDTHRDVKTRNEETILNASLHQTKPTTWVIAKKKNGRTFRDKSFHKFLEDKGYERELNDRGTKSEWFFITLEQALAELELFTKKPVKKEVILRTAQHYLAEKQQEAIDEGFQGINAGYCVRVGKTIISLKHASDNDWMPVYIGKNLTSQASAEKDNATFGIVPEMLTQSLHGVDEIKAGDLSKRTKQIIKNINEANKQKKQILFLIDEVDDGSHTKISRDILVPVIKHFMDQDMFGFIMPMSGTRIFRGEKILKELGVNYKELTLEYFEMQILQPETTCKRNFRHISFYSNIDDGLLNISTAMKSSNGRKSISTIIERLLDEHNDFDITIDPKFPHWFMKFCIQTIKPISQLVNLLNKNKSLNEDYYFAEITGDVTRSKEAEIYSKKIIADNPDKTCVFITQGMATTSYSVEGIGNSAVFTDNELTADDTQALPRSATWTEGKTECNMIVVTTNDSQEFSFDDIFEDETKMAKSREDKIEIYKELLQNNSMVHYVQGKQLRRVEVTEQNAEDVIDKKMRSMTKIASLMTVVNDLDEEVLDHILLFVPGNKGTSSKSKSQKADTFNPFGNDTKQTKGGNATSDKLTVGHREKILRAFCESAVNVPAIAREQQTTMEGLNSWYDIGIEKDLFFDVYNSSPMFKDRIDTIHSLCKDTDYLVQNYIDKLV